MALAAAVTGSSPAIGVIGLIFSAGGAFADCGG
jgi:hypothetical protein